MALATATISYNLDDLLGADLVPNSATLGVRTNIDGDTVIDTVGNVIRVGPAGGKLASSVGTIVVWIPGTGSNPASWQYYFDLTYQAFTTQPGGGYAKQRRTRTFGPFTVTADADLADLVAEQEVPPTYLSAVTALLDGYVDAAEAAAATAVDISGISTSDGVVQALVKNTGGVGPLTSAALAAQFATLGEVRSRVLTNGTDQTAALQAELDALYTAGGGTLILPTGTVRIDGRIWLSHNASTNPSQPPIHIKGQGARFSAYFVEPMGGTRLDMRYAGTYGKLVTNGLGLLEISGVTFLDGSSGSTVPWIYTTNTTLEIHDCSFQGNRSGQAADQDCIILGGINATYFGSGLDDGFQGYGTRIHHNQFQKIRRGVYGRTACNAVVITDNTFQTTCGSLAAAGAAIELDGRIGTGSESASGNYIGHNLIEMTGYAYGIKLRYSVGNILDANTFFDQGANSLASIWFDTGANGNRVIGAFGGNAAIGVHVKDPLAQNIVHHTDANAELSFDPRACYWSGENIFGLAGGPYIVSPYGDYTFMRVQRGFGPPYDYPRAIIANRASTTVTDGATTNGSTTITSATAAWTKADVGRVIGGTGIPSGAIITVRNSATSIEISSPATATATGVTIQWGRTGTTTQDQVGFERGHMVAIASGTTTTQVQAAAGTGATATISGKDMSGSVTITTGTSPAAGVQANITLALSAVGVNNMIVTPGNAAAADVKWYGARITAGIWGIGSGAAAWAPSTAYKFNYFMCES